MDLAEIFRVMRRRWYVLVPGLLLTVALTVGAYLGVPITYQSQSTVALLNSQKGTVAYDGNPFLSTQTSLTGMADILARNLNSDASIADLRAQGATGTTVAKIADNALGPLIWLTVTGTDKDAVLKSDRLLTSYAAKRLAQFQSSQSVYVSPSAMIRMTTIVPPQNPMAETKTRTEYLALATLMGIVISMVATFYVNARKRTPAVPYRARAARRSAAEPAAVAGTAAAGTDCGGTDPGPATGTGNGTETEADTESKTETKTDSDTSSDTDRDTGRDTGSDPAAGTDGSADGSGGGPGSGIGDPPSQQSTRPVPRAPWWSSADHGDPSHGADGPRGSGAPSGPDADGTVPAGTQTPRFV